MLKHPLGQELQLDLGIANSIPVKRKTLGLKVAWVAVALKNGGRHIFESEKVNLLGVQLYVTPYEEVRCKIQGCIQTCMISAHALLESTALRSPRAPTLLRTSLVLFAFSLVLLN